MPVKLDVTDHPINLRPTSGAGLCPTWGLSIGDKRIGTVWETLDGYAGQIKGTAAGETRQYTCPEKPFRSAVIERLGEMAERLGIA